MAKIKSNHTSGGAHHSSLHHTVVSHHKQSDMDKVKIKRVKKEKKKITTGEKVMAAVGVGSTLMGGAGAVKPQPQSTQFVRTTPATAGSSSSKIKSALGKIFGETFGVQSAKADVTLTVDNLNSVPYDVSLDSQISGLQSSGALTGYTLPTSIMPGSVLAYMVGLGDGISGTTPVTAPDGNTYPSINGYFLINGQWVVGSSISLPSSVAVNPDPIPFTLTLDNINTTPYSPSMNSQISALSLTGYSVPSMVTAGSVLAYMLGLGNAGNLADNTVVTDSSGNTWNYYDGYFNQQEAIAEQVSLTGGNFNGTVNSPFSTALQASENGNIASNFSYAVTSGTLPPGMTLDTLSGTLSGTPTTPGTYNFYVTATSNSTRPVSGAAPFSFIVNPAPVVATTYTVSAGAPSVPVVEGTTGGMTFNVFDQNGNPASGSVSVYSSDSSVASVPSTVPMGSAIPVTGGHAGSATITVSYQGYDATFTANVTAPYIATVTLTTSNINSVQYSASLNSQISSLDLTGYTVPISVMPGSVLAYMLGLGDGTSGTTPATAADGNSYPSLNGYFLINGEWVVGSSITSQQQTPPATVNGVAVTWTGNTGVDSNGDTYSFNPSTGAASETSAVAVLTTSNINSTEYSASLNSQIEALNLTGYTIPTYVNPGTVLAYMLSLGSTPGTSNGQQNSVNHGYYWSSANNGWTTQVPTTTPPANAPAIPVITAPDLTADLAAINSATTNQDLQTALNTANTDLNTWQTSNSSAASNWHQNAIASDGMGTADMLYNNLQTSISQYSAVANQIVNSAYQAALSRIQTPPAGNSTLPPGYTIATNGNAYHNIGDLLDSNGNVVNSLVNPATGKLYKSGDLIAVAPGDVRVIQILASQVLNVSEYAPPGSIFNGKVEAPNGQWVTGTTAVFFDTSTVQSTGNYVSTITAPGATATTVYDVLMQFTPTGSTTPQAPLIVLSWQTGTTVVQSIKGMAPGTYAIVGVYMRGSLNDPAPTSVSQFTPVSNAGNSITVNNTTGTTDTTTTVTENIYGTGTFWSLDDGTPFSALLQNLQQTNQNLFNQITAPIQVVQNSSGAITAYIIDGTTYTPQALGNAVTAVGQQVYQGYLTYENSSNPTAQALNNLASTNPSALRILYSGVAGLALSGAPYVYVPASYSGTNLSGSVLLPTAPSSITVSSPFDGVEAGQVATSVNPQNLVTSAQANAALAAIQAYHPNAQLYQSYNFSGVFNTQYNGEDRRFWIIAYTNNSGQQVSVYVSQVLAQMTPAGTLPADIPISFDGASYTNIPANQLVPSAVATTNANLSLSDLVTQGAIGSYSLGSNGSVNINMTPTSGGLGVANAANAAAGTGTNGGSGAGSTTGSGSGIASGSLGGSTTATQKYTIQTVTPTSAVLGSIITVTGVGFTQTSGYQAQFYSMNSLNSAPIATVSVSVTDKGLSFTLPSGLSVGQQYAFRIVNQAANSFSNPASITVISPSSTSSGGGTTGTIGNTGGTVSSGSFKLTGLDSATYLPGQTATVGIVGAVLTAQNSLINLSGNGLSQSLIGYLGASGTSVSFAVPNLPAGNYQLSLTNNGQTSANSINFVIGASVTGTGSITVNPLALSGNLVGNTLQMNVGSLSTITANQAVTAISDSSDVLISSAANNTVVSIIALAPGTAHITFHPASLPSTNTSQDQTIEVNITASAGSTTAESTLSLSATSLNMNVGGLGTVLANMPVTATASSSNNILVNTNGTSGVITIIALAPGTATITVHPTSLPVSDTSQDQIITVNVSSQASGGGSGIGSVVTMSLSQSIVKLNVGATATVTAVVNNSGVVSGQVSVTSQNNNILIFANQSTGVISIIGLASGTAAVTVHPTAMGSDTSQDQTIQVNVSPSGSGTGTNVQMPSITALSSNSGVVGANITILGNNFSPTASGNIVLFTDSSGNVTTVPINSVSTDGTNINFYVPNLPAGNYQLSLISGGQTVSGTLIFNITSPSGLGTTGSVSYGSVGGITTFSSIPAQPLVQGLQAPAGFQGLQMPAGYPADGGLQYQVPVPTQQVQGAQTSSSSYTVKKGDSLWKIAQKFYGSGSQWRKILSANPNCLSRPGNTKTLKIGFQLNIPNIN